jgi:molybdopterin molybdotransferase
LAALGLTEIKVIKRPSAAIIANGEELLRPGQQLVEAKIFCGNSSALAAQVSRCGGLPHIISIARDSLTALRRQIQRGLQFDIIITIGGSALGDRDLVKEVMAEMGKVVFTQLEMTPGKSTAFGLLRKEGENGQVQIPHFALSGSPTAAMLSFEALVRPAILKMQSLNPYPELVTGQAAQSFSNPGGKMRLAWVSLQAQKGLLIVRPAEGRGVLQSIAAANGIAVIPPGIQKVQAGDCIQMMLLDWFNQGRGCSEGVR